jgi:hypothetical protein
MAGKNDPSIYDDRSAIGSSEELDEYGVWVKSEPQDISSALPELEELPDFEGLDGPPDMPDAVSEKLDFSDIPENIDLSDFSGVLDGSEFEEISASELDAAAGFDGLSEDDFPEEEPVSDNTAGFDGPDSGETQPVSESGSDLSTRLLMKIADELSSIKKELTSLKTELSSVKSRSEPAEIHANGFFDEEDDEKIALTGDELDNILNTANFIEEAGSDAGAEAAETSIDISPLEENLPPADETDPDFDALKMDAPALDDFDISLDLEGVDELVSAGDAADSSSMFDSDGLEELREGVEPMTTLAEDTSYLEEDSLALLDESGDIDLSGAVIDEPDLSAGITENPVEEPAIDNIAIDLDMEEPAVSESPAEGLDLGSEDMMEIPVFEEPAADLDIPFVEGVGDFPNLMETQSSGEGIPVHLKHELKTVLSYMDQLLESLPEEKIEEFAKSEYFDTYKKLFEELGLV